jgi:hypothetical protein
MYQFGHESILAEDYQAIERCSRGISRRPSAAAAAIASAVSGRGAFTAGAVCETTVRSGRLL